MLEKPVLFLLPGLMCDEVVWEHQQQTLAPYAEVIIPVFRGFDSLVTMAEYVLTMAPQRFSVVGHSMGGRIAWELMELAGNRIDRFAVMDTGVHPVSREEPEKRQVLLDKANAEGLKAVAETWIPGMVHPDRQSDTQLIGEITAMILRNSVEDFLGQMQALLERKDQTKYLPHISQEVLLIAGEADSHSPPEQHKLMAGELKKSRLEIVSDAGHMVTMEKPEEVSTILLNWFIQNENAID
ncbi:MAG: alpha/beta hydrolase [Gammaproteobacteria bacterium]|nr:alpha/beta hydrolase [Gammaproteobacteria bacterium]